MTKKKTILVDLDGVLNKYSGLYDEGTIPEIREGAKDFIMTLHKDYDVKIFTSRDKLQTENWLIKHKLNNYICGITNVKEPAYLHIDDRCICFDGNFKDTTNKIKNFKPWYK